MKISNLAFYFSYSSLSGLLTAGTLTISVDPPVVDGADIAQLSGNTDAGGDSGHVWSNRPHQGQSFTTGSNPSGYRLTSVTLKNLNNTITNAPEQNVQIGSVILGAPNTFTALAEAETAIAPSYRPQEYLTFIFETPIELLPDTLYGFMWGTSGSGFVTVNADDPTLNEAYPGGEAFSSGGGNVPDHGNLLLRGTDRVFHVDLEILDLEDTDGDGLPNTWETQNGLDPDDNGENPNNIGEVGNPDNGADGNPDGDGLTNIEEFGSRTDPQKKDTDDDGLQDEVETRTRVYVDAGDTGTNPLVADTDGDTLNDGFEVEENPYITDPNQADTDRDGLSDAFEMEANPFVTHPSIADTDLDGVRDGLELTLGRDPTDGNDFPVVENAIEAIKSTPLIDGDDIAQLNPAGHLDPGGESGHIWSNRPLQGQTFTTGSNSGGYLLKSVSLVNQGNTIADNDAVFTVRIGTVTGTVFTEVASRDSNNLISYVPNDYITFHFLTPVELAPDTVYGFMWNTSFRGFTTWNNADTEYEGGQAFSSGAGGIADDANLVFHDLDREFHLDIESAGDGVIAIREILVVDTPGGPAVRLTWNSRNGRTYALDASLDLVDWGNEVDDSIGTGGDTTSTEVLISSLPISGSTIFFRIRDITGL